MARTHPLRATIYRGHLVVDGLWVPLADEAQRIALDHATIGPTGAAVLTPFAAAMAEREVRAALSRSRSARAAAIVGAQDEAGRLGREE